MTDLNTFDELKTLDNVVGGGLIIAVDGPSGTGKSTVCRLLATAADAKYLDTGAMYRVATLHVLRSGIDPSDEDAVAEATADLPLQVNEDPASTRGHRPRLRGRRGTRGARQPRGPAACSGTADRPLRGGGP